MFINTTFSEYIQFTSYFPSSKCTLFSSNVMYAEQGTGQGHPLSSHLYDLATDPLKIMVAESNITPRPILPNNKEIALEAYATIIASLLGTTHNKFKTQLT